MTVRESCALWMLLEERIGGQTSQVTSRRRFPRRWLAPPRGDLVQQESACQPLRNRRRRESLRPVWLSGPDLLIWIPPPNLSGERRALRSGTRGRKPCETLLLPAPKRRHHRRRL